MKLLSIEPTPSPNSMKLNVDEKLPAGERHTYTMDKKEQLPPFALKLLEIPGVKSVFRTADFFAVDRRPSADWAGILAAVRELFGASADGAGAGAGDALAYSFGEARVLVQMYRGIPMQIRVQSGGQESRAALGQRFTDAVNEAAAGTFIRERRLAEFGVRYGEPQEILEEVARELDAAYPDERLRELIAAAQSAGAGEGAAAEDGSAGGAAASRATTPDELEAALGAPDWQTRYAALSRAKPDAELLPLLAQAARDPQVSVRRLAVVYLGDLRIPEALPPLLAALKDSSAAVRRTAGDTLSDIGDPAAGPAMAEALGDANKLVRWRAARFLYEAGDEAALEALERVTAAEPEFEVKLQAEIAIARIRSGEEAAGSVWQQMTRMREQRQGEDEAPK
ncbi:conserved virulence factor C family protein [Cohnella hashimotonis]|uniref:Conserved virulence factor C family protein n=1 Tax=Cohnella hashimotonis TaxID=2826895 RepID=A0ABT6TBS9_9BACL|nr:conserved virulence factor C family protein [Cohnella hashimotonis]MDI4644120.1 conserved virulence factor C family protein [Cohnella hashimotonis]